MAQKGFDDAGERAVDVLGYISVLNAPTREALMPWARRIPAGLLARCRLIHVERGEELVSMFDRCEHVYVLCVGRIRTTTRSVSGSSFTIDEFEAPTVFGEMELLAQSPITLGSLVALSGCSFIAAPQADYLAWLTSDPEALLARSRWVVRSLLRQMGNARSLMGWSATRRLMFVLFQSCHQGTGRSENGGATIQATRAELAERAGVSTKTVSRALGELEGRQMLRRSGRKIVIDRDAYERLENEIRHELESEPHPGGTKEEQ